MLNDNHNYKLNIMYWLCIGYACRADKNPYRHDRRADSQCHSNYAKEGLYYDFVETCVQKGADLVQSIQRYLCNMHL